MPEPILPETEPSFAERQVDLPLWADPEASQPKAVTPLDGWIGHRLRARRKDLGLSQAQVARTIGVSGSQLGKYEAGEDRIAASRLARAVQALGVDYGYFLPAEALLGLAEAEQSVISPGIADDTQKLVEAFAMINGTELRQLAIELVAGIAKRAQQPFGGCSQQP